MQLNQRSFAALPLSQVMMKSLIQKKKDSLPLTVFDRKTPGQVWSDMALLLLIIFHKQIILQQLLAL